MFVEDARIWNCRVMNGEEYDGAPNDLEKLGYVLIIELAEIYVTWFKSVIRTRPVMPA